jgi:hypothetical protein
MALPWSNYHSTPPPIALYTGASSHQLPTPSPVAAPPPQVPYLFKPITALLEVLAHLLSVVFMLLLSVKRRLSTSCSAFI